MSVRDSSQQNMTWKLLMILLYIHKCNSQVESYERIEVVYEIAGIFENKVAEQTLAFNESTSKANIDERRLDATILNPPKTDSYSTWKELCRNEVMRPVAIFGPQHPVSDSAVRDQCAIAQIPHIQASWQPFDPDLIYEDEEQEDEESASEEPAELKTESEGDEDENEEKTENEETDEEEEEITFKNITINFYPDADEISIAYARLLKYYNWENFAVLYEDNFGLLRVQKILAEFTDKYPLFVRRLEPGGNNHKIFKELKKYQESRILLDCDVKNIIEYMNIAQTLDIVNHYQHYILLSLDASMVADKLALYPSNVTWLSLTEQEKLSNAQHFLASRVGAWTLNGASRPVYKFNLESLIMVDVANHVVEAIKKVEEENELTILPGPQYYVCDREIEPWEYGAALQSKILEKITSGVTGNIQFNSNGKRFNYTLFVNEIYVNERRTIARWESTSPEEVVENKQGGAAANVSTSKHFIVISRKAKPYFSNKEPCEPDEEDCDENEKYEGFSVDLVKNIFRLLHDEWGHNYTYEFVHTSDKSYGQYDKQTKKWDGLIGELLDKKADLAVCDLTITEERKTVVDFSVPFMTLGISILYTELEKIPPEMFSFLNPYSFEVWMYIATAYCVVSIVLFLCARISPPDWENPQPCDKDPEELENIWNFKNCAWLTMGSIMTQGCDILPKAFGSRWVCAMWWFFAVIVCQTYIAQLSASMTSAMESEAINSVEDLAQQTKVRYGAISGGSTFDFFKNSNDKMYRTIYENMKANEGVMVKSNDEGEKRVLTGRNKYAFFMESTSIDYKLKRDCRLKKVGGLLDSKDYGVAMPANSPFRTHINTAILRLKELTILDNIKDKWWNKKYGAKVCEKPVEDDVEGDLEMEHLYGLFVVLVVGLVFSLFVTAAEFADEVRNIVIRERVTHKEAFIQELKASLNFSQLQKPILRNPSRAPSIVSNKDQLEKQERRATIIENFLDLEKVAQ